MKKKKEREVFKPRLFRNLLVAYNKDRLDCSFTHILTPHPPLLSNWGSQGIFIVCM